MLIKTLLKVGGLWLVLLTASLGAESSRSFDKRLVPPAGKSKTICDPVCELRSQDSAFSLLMETFRQHQAYNIETDYQLRLQALVEKQDSHTQFFIESNTEGLKMLRRFIFGLAKRERELRMTKLETEVANFQAAYSCVRKIDEDYVGEKVPKNLSQQAAQAQLKEMVIIAPGTLAKGDATHARSIPASLVLMNPPLVPVNDAELVEPCD